MKTKRFNKVLALSMFGLLALTACNGTVEAKPTQYNDALITTPSYTDEIYNNIASVVYDAIENDGVGSEVLDQILYLYSVSAFGPLNERVKINDTLVGDSQITLQQAATDSSKIDAFVLAHKVYWDGDSHDSQTATESEKERVRAKYDTVEDRIAEAMYDKISGGTYTDRHLFSEERFLQSLRASMESVANPSTVEEYIPRQILPSIEPKDVFKIDEIHPEKNGYLHRSFYDGDNRYIVDKVVPGIYRQLLTEQYVYEDTYNTLGRSYAREVNIIKFSNNENVPDAAFFLAKELLAEINDPDYENGIIHTYEIDEEIEDAMLQRFKDYSIAQVGNSFSNDPNDPEYVYYDILHNRAELTLQPSAYAEIDSYFQGTSYGDLAKKYEKMKNTSEFGINTELENSFTNSGAYPTYVGLAQQKMTLAENDSTTNGWFVKNGGLSDLPEAIRSRLFNIGVATGVVDKPEEKVLPANNRSCTYDSQKDEWVWHEAENEKGYVCRINGHYFLKKASRLGDEKIDNDILHYDESSKSYYIIEIKQAVSSSKLSKNGSRNYTELVGAKLMEEIVNEVNKVVSKGETYSSLATKKYLKAMDIKYHDQNVYDYFKSNYPELFGEEADSSSESEAE